MGHDQGGRRQVTKKLKAWLVVAALEEEATLARCLDSVDASALPAGVTWAEWLVVDDGSADATPSVVTGWAAGHPPRHLHVATSERRQGKPLCLEQARQWFLSHAGPDDVLVGVDADVVVDSEAFVALLAPFAVEPGLTAAWGIARPAGKRRGRRASTFQMELVHDLAATLGPNTPRAEGRLWALRPQRIPGFAWRDEDVVDDVQLAAYVADHGTPSRSVPEAVAWATPARGLGDFHRQTGRSVRTRRAMPRVTPKVRSGSLGPGATARVVLQAGLDDPGAFAAYSLARAISTLRTPRGHAAHSEPSEHVHKWKIAAKAGVLVRTISRVRNWPSVLAAYGRARAFPGRQTAEMQFTFRDGTSMACRRDFGASFPVFEVFIDDDYRIEVLRRLLPDEPVVVIDVGAHVGSASVAFARAFRVRSVICAEPSRTSAVFLRRNLSSNGVPSSVVEAAVGATAGSVELVGGRAGSCGARVSRGEGSSDATPDRLTVPMVAMSDLLARAGEGPVVVKMDCEGSEYDIVGGTPATAWGPVRVVVLEYHPVAGTGGWRQLVERLIGLGFRLVWHLPKQPGLGTACFVRPESVNTAPLDPYGEASHVAPISRTERDR